MAGSRDLDVNKIHDVREYNGHSGGVQGTQGRTKDALPFLSSRDFLAESLACATITSSGSDNGLKPVGR